MTTANKNCPCPSPEIVAVPGVQGSAGADGTNGLNAFTLTTDSFVIPAVLSTVAIKCASVAWCVIGQVLFVSDGTRWGHYQVTAVQTSSAQITAKALGYNGDTLGNGVLTIGTSGVGGATVVPGGVQGPQLASSISAAVGLSQALNNTANTQLGSLTLQLAAIIGKKYLLCCTARVDYVGCTLAATHIVTLKLRETLNSNSDLSNGVANLKTAVVTTATYTAGILTVIVPYTTVGVSDVIQPMISIDASSYGAGNVQVIEGSLSALLIS